VSHDQITTLSRPVHYHGYQGLVRVRTNGIIESEMDNLGRRLVNVQWDNSVQMYVFPDEIELTDMIETDKHAV